jgi:Pro-kumamolisin, activation domain/PKD domain
MGPRALVAVGFVALLLLSSVAAAQSPSEGSAGVAGADSPHPPVSTADAPVGGSGVTIAPAYSAVPGTRVLGPANGTAPMDVAVGLAPRDPTGLASYPTLLYMPGSSEYGHFLSPSALASRYGASPTAVAAAVGYFRSFGLAATASPDDLTVEVEGPTASVGSAFGTTFDAYATASGRSFVSHPTSAELPAIAPWTGALGLGNVSPIVPAVASVDASRPLAGPAAACAGTESALIPCQVWGAYDLADDLANHTDGTGLTVAVVDTYDSAEPQTELVSDLAAFDEQFSLPTPLVRYLYPVPTSTDLNTTGSSGWGLEEALDLEWAHATAPGATIDMTFSPNPSVGLYEAIDDLVANDLANVISLSWGEPDVGVFNAYDTPCATACNASTDGSYAILSPVLEFAAAEGISVFAATGDCGAADGTSGVATNFPASDPYVTGVGGTDLTASAGGKYDTESGWTGNATGATSPGCRNQGGSGGGYSPFPRPYWQNGTGLSHGTTRADPDVSAIAAPGVQIVQNGFDLGVEGTSVATPIWAGIAAIADQLHGGDLGFLNPQLYAILRSSAEYATDFHDITSGSNGYSAGAGWDPVTGIGTPVGGALIAALARTSSEPSNITVTLNATQVSGDAPLRVSFFENATGGSGEYPVAGVDFGDGTAGATTDGEVSHEYVTPGVYAAQAYVFDSSGNASDSIPVAIVVGSGSTLSVSLVVSDRTPATGASVALTVRAMGGIAPYAYDLSFGDGTFVNGSVAAEVNHTYAVAGGYCAVAIVSDAASPPDGGESVPVGISVGGVPAPACSVDRGSLGVSPAPGTLVRDAPADFPLPFQVTGGIGVFSEQFASSDPYIAACQCTIFRSPGTYPLTLFVNGTDGERASGATSVTVAPALRATFTTGPLAGPAPLTVDLGATVSGGYGTNRTTWDFGDGGSTSGTTAQATYSIPGTYWLVGHVVDDGDGNASEAFLVDVTSTSGPAISATIEPAVDIASGTTVRFSASASGGVGPTTFDWTLGDGATALSSSVARTYDAPPSISGSSLLTGSVGADAPTSGWTTNVGFSLGPFFAVESDGFLPAADALVLNDSLGPLYGVPPFVAEGNATAAGPGLVSINWSSGAGENTSGASVQLSYPVAGSFTATVEATDSFGDVAWDAHGVASGFQPIGIEAGPSVAAGPAPLVVTFSALATGPEAPFAYGWQFGDGGSASVGNVTHTYLSPGTFVAELTVRASDGHVVDANYTIVVAPPSTPAPGWVPFGATLAELALAGGVAAAAVVLAVVLVRRRRPPTP